LFNTLQYARKLSRAFSIEIARSPLKKYKSKIWILLWVGFFVILSLTVMVSYVKWKDYQDFENLFAPPKKKPSSVADKKVPSQPKLTPTHKDNSPTEPKSSPEDTHPEIIRNEENDSQANNPPPELDADSDNDFSRERMNSREPASIEEDQSLPEPIPPPPFENPPDPSAPPPDFAE
jgi:cytoskeletal protein RodZ